MSSYSGTASNSLTNVDVEKTHHGIFVLLSIQTVFVTTDTFSISEYCQSCFISGNTVVFEHLFNIH